MSHPHPRSLCVCCFHLSCHCHCHVTLSEAHSWSPSTQQRPALDAEPACASAKISWCSCAAESRLVSKPISEAQDAASGSSYIYLYLSICLYLSTYMCTYIYINRRLVQRTEVGQAQRIPRRNPRVVIARQQLHQQLRGLRAPRVARAGAGYTRHQGPAGSGQEGQEIEGARAEAPCTHAAEARRPAHSGDFAEHVDAVSPLEEDLPRQKLGENAPGAPDVHPGAVPRISQEKLGRTVPAYHNMYACTCVVRVCVLICMHARVCVRAGMTRVIFLFSTSE